MQIQVVADQLGIKPSSIRFYEKEGLLPGLQRESGQRWFSDADLLRLKVVTTAKRMGFSLKEIKLLLTGLSASEKKKQSWVEMAEQKMVDLDQIIKDAKRMKRLINTAKKCGCVDLKVCRILGK